MRAFVAITPPVEWRDRIAAWQQRAADHLPPARWTNPQTMHLTLQFLGDVPVADSAPIADAIAAACRSTAPFALRLAGPGTFPNLRRPRVLWIGIAGDLDTMGLLQKRMATALGPWIVENEKKWHPHLTVARFTGSSSRAPDFVREQADVFEGIDAWRVDAVQFFRSTLSANGARHEILSSSMIGADR